MTESNIAIEKLQRIQALWAELGRTKLNTPEYDKLIGEIRKLSAEYYTSLDALKSDKAPAN